MHIIYHYTDTESGLVPIVGTFIHRNKALRVLIIGMTPYGYWKSEGLNKNRRSLGTSALEES